MEGTITIPRVFTDAKLSPKDADKFFSPQLLRELRKAMGHSTRSLAQKAGVSKNTIYSAERGIHRPQRRNIRKIAFALGVPEDVVAMSVKNSNQGWGFNVIDIAFPS